MYQGSCDLVATAYLGRAATGTAKPEVCIRRATSEVLRNARNCFANRFEIERATDSLLAAIAHP